MKLAQALGITKRADVELGEYRKGLTARDGSPLMSRTDNHGRALDFDQKGFDGRGTPDEDRARELRNGRR